MAIEPRDVLYCGACGMPPEYCEYGPDFETHCEPWLQNNHPEIHARLWDKINNSTTTKKKKKKKKNDIDDTDVPKEPWTIEERLTAFYQKYQPDKVDGIPAILEKYAGKEEKLFAALVKKYGPEPEDPYITAKYGNDDDDDDDDEDEDDDDVDDSGDMAGLSLSEKKKKRRGAGAKKVNKVDTRVIIQKISRNKKKAVTIVVGMDTVPGVKLKDVSKAFSKRFAGSSSVKDAAGGTKEIIIQGDHSDDVAAMIVNKFSVPADSVFLDIDGEFVPWG